MDTTITDENPTLQDCEEGRVHVVEPLTSHINGKRTESKLTHLTRQEHISTCATTNFTESV